MIKSDEYEIWESKIDKVNRFRVFLLYDLDRKVNFQFPLFISSTKEKCVDWLRTMNHQRRLYGQKNWNK